MKIIRTAALFAALAAPMAAPAQTCEQLASLALPKTEVVLARTVTGNFTPDGATSPLQRLPEFCRIIVRLKPTADSAITSEIWLPTRWNTKLLAIGSGGWGGSIAYAAMADAVRRGYAAAATDDGHEGGSAEFAMGHPQKLIDFGYRAEHETAVTAKALIVKLYARPASRSYWQGCSGGGREGLIQAYRYPDEFDGVIAGDPANIRRNAWALWLASQTLTDPAAFIAPGKYPMIHDAVLAACDALDGVKDGLISDPHSCHMDFSVLACKAQDGPDCLTAAQVRSAQALISPATTRSGKVLFPPLEPGTELRWGRMAGGPGPAELFWDEFRYVVYQNPDWDWHTFDLERDAAKAHAIDRDVDELDARLGAFAKHGGKLILYHGWADQQVAPGATIDFFESVQKSSADPKHADDWVRLFMAPGMAHCAGGEGPDAFDSLSALEHWVEQGQAPQRLIAAQHSAGQVDRTRPLCPYPQVSRYNGTGSINEAANFTCASTH